nr:putative transmembrane protein ZNF593OS [Nothobranchius furzeri]
MHFPGSSSHYALVRFATEHCWCEGRYLRGGVADDLSASLPAKPTCIPSADMIIRLGRLTPGYFRLLQRQVAGEVQTQPQDRAINQIAMMLAIMGLSLSYYSAKQMTEKVHVQPAP